MQYFVGLDWAAREHAVCVLDERGAVTVRFTVAHTNAGITELITRLGKFGAPAELRVAIERPSGLVVDTLVDGGFAVVPIHPNAVKAARPRYSAAQGKTDLGDAYMLADLLRTDGHRFRTLSPLSDETKALRGLVRTRDDLVERRIAAANQLRSLLGEFWAGAAEIFADIDSPIALDFLERYPTPQLAAGQGARARHQDPGSRLVSRALAVLAAARRLQPREASRRPPVQPPPRRRQGGRVKRRRLTQDVSSSLQGASVVPAAGAPLFVTRLWQTQPAPKGARHIERAARRKSTRIAPSDERMALRRRATPNAAIRCWFVHDISVHEYCC